jgi:tetratricopeptide (TPR) repeat protein
VDLGGAAGRPRKKSPLDSASSSAVDMEDAADAAPVEDEAEAETEPASGRTRPRKAAAEAATEEEEEAPARPARRAAAAEEEEESAAKKPAKARAGCGALVLVGVLGLLVGAATPIGLLVSNVVDPSLIGISTKTNAVAGGPNVNPGGQKPPPPQGGAPVVADAGQHLKSGDFAKAMEVLNTAPDGDQQVQADRGTARWMSYLQEQMNKGAKPNAADEPVQKARTDLEAAAAKDNPEAILALGNLQEYTAGPAEALKTYQDAAKKFAGKPWARVFQAQIDRLDSMTARPAEGGKPQAAAPHPGDGDLSARALLTLLIAFQGAGNEAGGDKGPDEAGFDFWAAVKLAQAGKYPDAIKELEAARTAHDKLRFSRLRKAQNPLSDPTEEIFLRAAEEIKAYWTVQSSLAQLGIAGRTPAEIQKSLEAMKEQGPSAGQIKAVSDKLKTTPDKAAAAVDALVKQHDDAVKKAATLETSLTAAQKDADAAKKLAKDNGDKLAQAETQLKSAETKFKAVGDRLEAAGLKGADPAKAIDTLVAERADANKALDAVVTKVNLANAKVDRKDVLKGVDKVVEAALVKDPKGELMESRQQLNEVSAALAQRHTPEQMLDIWLPVLADRRGTGSEPALATADAARVRGDGGATPVAKQKAAAVLGLAKRDTGDVEAARTLLTEAVGGPGPKAPWQAQTEKALKQLTDPAAYYLPTARFLYEEGHYKEADALLAQGARLFKGKEAASLQALGSLARLAEARDKGKGKVDAADPLVAAAKKDAQAAADAGDAEGQYALGRISEELGNLADARAAYTKALTAHRDNDEAGARYRLALARVLKLQAEKTGGRAAAARGLPLDDMRREPLVTLVLLVELGMQPGGGGADQDEATRLLKEVESAKDGPDTFLLKAQAQALLGQWTPALKTYAAGLRAHVRRDYADVLADLVEHHPALRRPAALDPPNPVLADAYYSLGLRNYFARRYGDAEEALTQAIQYDDQDARYFYFLGLSRLALGKTTDAENAFHDGSQLELLNRPGREAVSTALERVQGPARQAVNRARP